MSTTTKCSDKVTFPTQHEGEVSLAAEQVNVTAEWKHCEECQAFHVILTGSGLRDCWPAVKYATEGHAQAACTKDRPRVFKCAHCARWHTGKYRRPRREQTPEQKFRIRQNRQALTAKRRIAGLKAHRTRVAKHLELAKLTFQRGSELEPMFRAAMSASLFNKLVYSWNQNIRMARVRREGSRPFSENIRRVVPKARGITLLDFPRVGPKKEGGRIPLREALQWHMTDAEVLHWSERNNGYKGKVSISDRTRAIHFYREPLTYGMALHYYILDQHWKTGDTILAVALDNIYKVADRDLRRTEHRNETDGRKRLTRHKFTTRSRFVYWEWLVRHVHAVHMRRWPTEHFEKWLFPNVKPEFLENIEAGHDFSIRHTRQKKVEGNQEPPKSV